MSVNQLAILLIVVSGLTVVPNVQACGCSDDRPWAEVASSDVLFLGRLVKAEWTYTPESAPWLTIPISWSRAFESNSTQLTFEVERWWKGSGERYVRVFNPSSSCEMTVPPVGVEMLIEASTSRGANFTWLCARSVPVYPEVFIQYIEGQPGYEHDRLLTRDSLQVHLGTGFEPTWRLQPWLIIALIASIGGVLLWRRRRAAA